jgi:hypothetical protein
MHRYMTHLKTEIDFVDSEGVQSGVRENDETHLAEALPQAAQNLSPRTISSTKVGKVIVAELKD